MHTITDCPRCGNDFMYHQTDTHLHRELESNIKIMKEYPLQDGTWPSRRWKADRSDYCDLSGGYDVICQDCDEKEKKENENEEE